MGWKANSLPGLALRFGLDFS